MAPTEPEIVIENREELFYLLSEAAEIEHGLMGCYLYAAYSLKKNAPEHSAEEQAAIERWRATILDVARDEMMHLALVSNILSSVGSAPHFVRANFPVMPGYHPAGVVVSLAPFDQATLDHFIYLERPEGVTLADGAGFAVPTAFVRGQAQGRLVPSAQDYATVGHLYRGIRSGLTALTRSWGESKLFIGDPDLQMGTDIMPFAGLIKVRNLADACAAVETIVQQGEGGAHDQASDSHYVRFIKVREEYQSVLHANPGFAPAYPAARNPVMRRPIETANHVWITAEPAASLLDLGNALYALMLRALIALYSTVGRGQEMRAALVDMALLSMRNMAAVAQRLAALPAHDAPNAPNAGLTFAISRSLHAPPHARALHILAEDARGARQKLTELAPPGAITPERLDELAATFEAFAQRPDAFAEPATQVPTHENQAQETAAPATSGATADPAPAPDVETAVGKAVTIYFEAKRCIHSRHCVLDAPDVFRANTPGAWIHPDSAPVDELVAVARSCPSGAIRYHRLDGKPDERAPPVNVAHVRENGPLAFHGALAIASQPMFRATLCRCGASKNKPFCDGSHAALPFAATGEPPTGNTEPLARRDGPLEVRPRKDGPLAVSGSLELCAGTGRVVTRVVRTALCRCGGSSNKPFCDGTHAKIGFRADGE